MKKNFFIFLLTLSTMSFALACGHYGGGHKVVELSTLDELNLFLSKLGGRSALCDLDIVVKGDSTSIYYVTYWEGKKFN